MSPGTVLLTLAGDDSPGAVADVLTAVAPYDEDVLDLGQVVVRGRLSVSLLLTCRSSADVLYDAVAGAARAHGLDVTLTADVEDAPVPQVGRASVVVIGAPLRAAALAAITAAIVAQGARIERVRRLVRTPLTGLELQVSGAEVPILRRALAMEASAHSVDVAVAPGGLDRRGRRLLVMDVDSTLIQDEVIELLARHAGVEAQVAAVTERAMRGELDFAESLHERVATLAGLPESVLADVRRAVRLTPGAATLVRTVKRLGFTVAVVSGGFIEIVGPLAAELGIDHAHANTLEIRDGHLTGRVTGQVVDRAEKARALRRFAHAAELPLSRTVAVGDGANDLDMLAIAGLGIAFNAKPVVRAEAHASVSVPYLDAVLYLLGISRDEIDAAEANIAQSLDSPHA
ncbi:phosphoserine phosphatase SerB [Allobranchiibius sp. CTAmp26]|uniref:phosphoserine phosphatase SerB n=1 Tax=Allobranchiibius sp. CTAmp26 TaxID=2815214 RepID=UPI001AA1A9B5|nr:phosphoserine phosphatase SerB [Allobranchiibius sp. CTAmp26]MBO1754600.1 phosphoserine phosphatase SerB [Allobranchiibius sp. CTAmp26]